MKAKSRKQLIKTVISLVMILSLFAGFAPLRLSSYAETPVDNPAAEPVRAAEAEAAVDADAAVQAAPVVQDVMAEAAYEVEDVPEAEDVSEVQDAPEVQDVSEMQDAPEVQDVPEAQDVPEVQDAADVQDAPEAQSAPEASETAGNAAIPFEVDFHFDGQSYVLKGGTSDALDTILNELGLNAAVTGVVSSDPELFSCELRDGVWTVSANSAFTSQEYLTLTFEDGNVLELCVTDDFAGNPSGNIVCVYDEETKTLTVKLADGVDAPPLHIEGETEEERSQRLSAYAVQSSDTLKELKDKVTTILIDEGVTGVGWDENLLHSEGVFQEFTALTLVTALDTTCSTLINIGWSAFRKCYDLEVFDFSAFPNLEIIRRQAFSVTSIDDADMSGNEKLTEIGFEAFAIDENLKNQTNSSGKRLTETLTSVSIPAGVTVIGEDAFQNRTKIETIYYDAAHFDHSVNSSGSTKPYLASSTFAEAGSYAVFIGSDVEYLPQGFFKAFKKAGEAIIFQGVDDGDSDKVSGRVITLNALATDQGISPYTSFPTSVIVDESGVVYEQDGEELKMLYISPSITQYSIPGEIYVDGSAVPADPADISDYAQSQIKCRIRFDLDLGGLDPDDPPAFKTSDTILAVGGATSITPYKGSDLTKNSFTVVKEDGKTYVYTLAGWLWGDTPVGDTLILDGSEAITLTAVWDESVMPAPASGDAAVPAAETWANRIRAAQKDAKLCFDGTRMQTTLFAVCGDYAHAMRERPDVTVTIEFAEGGSRRSMTFAPGTDLLGALKAEGLSDADPIAFSRLAELAGVDVG